jgi:tRNA-2-methylthio-N6-dimethylallyladenosine synthase
MTLPVLVTGPGRLPGQIAGRSPWLQPVHFPGSLALVGQEVPVRILAGKPNSLSGQLAAGDAACNDQRKEEPAPA